MKSEKNIIEKVLYFLLIMIAPLVITILINGRQIDSKDMLLKSSTGRDVLIQGEDANILVDVEQYIAGILPGVVDYNSDEKYMEAQIVAIRTNIYSIMGDRNIINARELPYDYYSEESCIEKWGREKYSIIQGKYIDAIMKTTGKIIE